MSVDLVGIRKGRPATAAGPLVTMIVTATSYILWATTPGRKAILRKIMAYNNGAGVVVLNIGYLNLAAVFVPCLPSIALVNNGDVELSQREIPLCGNHDGFIADTTALTGTLGNIIGQSVGAGIGAGTPITVQIEVEEI